MANVIQIKRNSHTSTSAPSTSNITYGELGYNNNNGAGGKLYIGGKGSDGSASSRRHRSKYYCCYAKS